MFATVERSIPIAVVAPIGRLDALNAPGLRARCDAIMTEGTTRIVIDLGAVIFLDSAGLAAMVGALKRARASGGDVKLAMPHDPAVLRILELTRFDRVFDIREDAEVAVASFASKHGRRAGR
ncbi:MAG: STAS domain-containing protein [Chloroflexota bacterium]